MIETTLEVQTVETTLVPSPATYAVLRPAAAPGPMPLLIWLHGGGGDETFLEVSRAAFEACWAEGTLPPVVAATPSAGRSLYLDRKDGTERWESWILDELIPHLQTTTGAGVDAPVLIGGVSMGGMGSLRMAFKHPDRFLAVAALEPGIEAAGRWEDVSAHDRTYRDERMLATIYGDPLDTERYEANHPLNLADRNVAAIVASRLAIYFEVGDLDFFHLFHGAEQLHRRLFDIGVRHEFRMVRGGDHLGPTLGPRMTDALQFLGRSLAGLPEPFVLGPGHQAFADAGTRACGFVREVTVAVPGGELEVHVTGEGPLVVLVPSLGRGADDFAHLAKALAVAGFTAARPQPRGIGGSTAPHEDVSMADLVADVAAVIEAVGGPGAEATVIGHAFGNRVARMTATEHPALVNGVVLLACGGKVPPEPEHHEALLACFDDSLSAEDHLAAVGTAFFAEGGDPSAWANGWHPLVAKAQGAATRATSHEMWWTAGKAPVLVVQPAEDVIALPANARDLVDALGDRGELVVMPRAGHALLPEQPDAVAATVLRWLRRA